MVCRALVLLVLFCLASSAAVALDLYESRTIVTGQREATRIPGFQRCLEQVLVKVSGDPRLTGDPRIIDLANSAAAFVKHYRYADRMAGIPVHDEQGTNDRPYDLVVIFNRAKIDAALHSLGRKPWTGPRPPIGVFLAVSRGSGSYVLSAEADRGADMRRSLAAAAELAGLQIEVPTQGALDNAGFDVSGLGAADPARLAATAASTDPALIGTLVWSDEALGWIADWRFGAEGQSYRWQVRGVSFDEAFRNGMRGAAQILSGNGQPDRRSMKDR